MSPLRSLDAHKGPVTCVAISTDGKRIVSGSGDTDAQGKPLPGEVQVWDADKGQKLRSLEGHKYPVTSVAISADGKRIVSGSGASDAQGKPLPGEVKVWDASTGKAQCSLDGHTGPVTSVAISADGKRIFSGSGDQTVKIWDTEKQQLLFSLPEHDLSVEGLAISPDGKRIVSASADKTLKVWDADTYQELHHLKGHTDIVLDVSFSPDGKRIASASADKKIKLWDVETGQELLTLSGHRFPVRCIAFSAKGAFIVSGSTRGALKVWSVE